jgi:hypothetical protein
MWRGAFHAAATLSKRGFCGIDNPLRPNEKFRQAVAGRGNGLNRRDFACNLLSPGWKAKMRFDIHMPAAVATSLGVRQHSCHLSVSIIAVNLP